MVIFHSYVNVYQRVLASITTASLHSQLLGQRIAETPPVVFGRAARPRSPPRQSPALELPRHCDTGCLMGTIVMGTICYGDYCYNLLILDIRIYSGKNGFNILIYSI